MDISPEARHTCLARGGATHPEWGDRVTVARRPMSSEWRTALVVVIVASLLCAPVSWVDDGVTPSWVVYPLVLLVALWRVHRGRGALFVAVAALVFLVVHLPWTWAAVTGADHNPLDRASPSSPAQWLITLFVVPLVTTAVGWAAWTRDRKPLESSALRGAPPG